MRRNYVPRAVSILHLACPESRVLRKHQPPFFIIVHPRAWLCAGSLVFAGAWLACPAAALAQVSTWTNSGSGDWTAPGNWSSGVAPNGAVEADLENGGTAVISTPGQNVGLLQLGTDNPGGAGSLVIQGGGSLTQSSSVTAFTPIGTGSLTISGAGSSFTIPNDLVLGRNSGTSSVIVEGGGQLITGSSFIGEGLTSTSSGISATLSGIGSFWNAGEFIGVGGGTTPATLTISDGAVMTAQSSVAISSIGSGAAGVATVTGAGSQLLLNNTTLAIGELINGGVGNGTLTIANGGLVTAQTVMMGAFDAGTSGVLNVDGTPGAQGVLLTANLTKDVGSATVNFNGGILRAGADSTSFISGFNAGDIVIQSGGMFVDSNGFDVVASSALSGTGGLTKLGAGTLTLNGNSTTLSGSNEVVDGTLEVGDASDPDAVLGGDLAVDAGGTLRGHGTIGGNLANRGLVMPGGTIGTLTVDGNYNQAANATLAIEISPTAGSQLKVNGAAALGGGLQVVYDPGTYTTGQFTNPGTYVVRQYTILTAADGVSGRFSSVTNSVLAGADLGALRPVVLYQPDQVDLQLDQVIAPVGTSIYTALGSTLSLNAQTANATLLDRLSQPPATGKNLWIDPSDSLTKVGATHGEPGFDAHQYGFMTGLERQLGDYTLGVAGGYDHADIDEQTTGDSGSTDTLRAALYGSRWFGPLGISATLGYGLDFLAQKRPFGVLGTAEGNHLGQELTAAGQASLPLALGSFTLTPSAGLRYAYFHGNAFTENGAGGQDLAVGADNVHSLQPYVEMALDKAFGDPLRPIDVKARLGYAQELLDTNRALTVGAQDGTLFAAPGANLPRGHLTSGVSVSVQPTRALSVRLSYDALLATSHASSQAGDVRLDYRF